MFLSSKGYIHRDIAARNILLTSDFMAKIADFGLCRYSDDQLYTIYHDIQLPVKWLAPEAMETGQFTVLTDVYEYRKRLSISKQQFQMGLRYSDV